MNFYFFGDSICFGQYVSIEKTWICKVATLLNKKFNDNYIILNPSIINDTSQDALKRFHHDVLLRNPSLLYIQFGMNDCNIWDDHMGIERVSPLSFEANLNELYVHAKAFNIKIIIMGTNHPSNKNKEYDSKNLKYNDIIRKVCQNSNIFLIDNEKEWKKYNHIELLLPDGIHLNEKGHDIYYKNFMNHILEIL